jgi:hypothetical protein
VPEIIGAASVPLPRSVAARRPETRVCVHSGSVRERSSATSICAVNWSAESGASPALFASMRALPMRVATSPVAATRTSVNLASTEARASSAAISPNARSPLARESASRPFSFGVAASAQSASSSRSPAARSSRYAVRIQCAG